MIKFAFIKNEKVMSVLTPADDNAYTDGVVYNGATAKAVDHTIPDADILQMQYFDGELVAISEQPSPYHNYDRVGDTWILDVALAATTYANNTSQNISKFIIKDNNFPEWKQVNYADRFSELSIQKLTSSITADEQGELDNIVLIRSWKNSLISEYNRIESELNTESTIAEMETSVNSLVFTPAPFIL